MIRAGVIGLGRIGHGFGVSPGGDPLCHTESYARIPGSALVFGVDPDADARAAFQARFPGAAAFASAADIPADLRAEVVSVATPTGAHAAGVEAALRVGARVILAEKPLAGTVVEAEQIAARCRGAGALLLVNYSRRWTPMLATLRAAVAPGGCLGPPAGACIRYTGGLLNNGTHWIDLLLALLGQPAAVVPVPAGEPDDPDGPGGSLALRFPSGCVAHIVRLGGVEWSAGEGELWSAAGMLRFSQSGAHVSFQPRVPSVWAGFAALGPKQVLLGDGLRGHLLEAAREAVGLAAAGAPGVPTCGAAEGLRALSVVEQVSRSRRTA